MKLVVGLGNPGPRYADTRHNIGFRIAERFAARQDIVLDEACYDGRLGRGILPGVREPVAVFQPLTYMNRSGGPVAQAVRGLGLEDLARDLLVAYDDVDLPYGRLRLRPGGGAGGHNGVADIMASLESRQFARLRFGVGRPAGMQDTVDWVLGSFSTEETVEIPTRLAASAEAIELSLLEGVEVAMNRFNRDPDAAET